MRDTEKAYDLAVQLREICYSAQTAQEAQEKCRGICHWVDEGFLQQFAPYIRKFSKGDHHVR